MRPIRFMSLILIIAGLGLGCVSAPTPTPPPTVFHPPTITPGATAALSATAAPTVQPTPILPPPQIVRPVSGLSRGTGGFPWWNDTVFYQVFIRSFYDSDGDGIGDLNGLIAKLDYLNDGDPATTTDLGVTGLWLMPIHPAASYHGYDVLDYYQINPQYGTLDDFKRLLTEAHQRGIRVLIDWVPNHVSAQHAWFQSALDPQSAYRDWFVWAAEPAGSGWHPGVNSDFYYGYFWEGMPDLNYNNPAVTAQMLEVASFWLKEIGVDGFRIDAIKYLIEDRGFVEHTPATHAWLQTFHTTYKEMNPEALMIGEIWDSSGLVADYTTSGAELDLGFDFDLAKAILWAAAYRRNTLFNDTLTRDLTVFPSGQFGTFITNHDQDRVMSVLGDDANRARTAAALLFISPGVPFVYYGEELGLLGSKPDELIRTPMQWSAATNGGFTTAPRAWESLNNDYVTKNVAVQTDDPASLLSFYRHLIQLRNQHVALRIGDTVVLETGNRSVVALLRYTADEVILALVNLGKESVSDYGLTGAESPLRGGYQPVFLLESGSPAPLTVTASGGLAGYQPVPRLPPYATLILQLQPQP